jgi:hypothetical protein
VAEHCGVLSGPPGLDARRDLHIGHGVHGEHVRLHDVAVALRVARVVAGVLQLDAREVEGAVGEHVHLLVRLQRGQVGAEAAPHDRRRRRARHVALDLDVVADARRHVVHLQGLVQRHHRHACGHKHNNKEGLESFVGFFGAKCLRIKKSIL